MERKIVWKYDPFHKKSILDAVQEVISGVFMKFMSSHMEMQAKTFTGWRQCDGHSCGVLVVQWFEQYLSLEEASAVVSTDATKSCSTKDSVWATVATADVSLTTATNGRWQTIIVSTMEDPRFASSSIVSSVLQRRPMG
ncbi:uncharacterized protein PITG_21285 [Phytophthora infestans T30-4]|uniref:Ubiquitin-like protease family profile domain-containing protein n=1 Tax=Phytophthora infestans (strain T30-4) TaxID=403677 RepID=D0P3J7_PHYIT|nr:uncharacterized protein PITG_21285 [Phytophthora infestans T30-4]EEY60041.1 hypothetical protein PITG_21285 [Phytophthora infestans T30-4]|eukprot:XP_002895131.1 hypothetical protein PITG_21285 [Phytophthora infestans T30-4]